MSVWIVFLRVDYEGSAVLRVFATEDAAQACAKEMRAGRQYNRYEVEEWPVHREHVPAGRRKRTAAAPDAGSKEE
jgi:hypothetical protein